MSDAPTRTTGRALMRWLTKYPSPEPPLGEKRERTYFAWCRIDCDDGFTRWLEHVRVVEVWANRGYSGYLLPAHYWRTVEAHGLTSVSDTLGDRLAEL